MLRTYPLKVDLLVIRHFASVSLSVTLSRFEAHRRSELISKRPERQPDSWTSIKRLIISNRCYLKRKFSHPFGMWFCFKDPHKIRIDESHVIGSHRIARGLLFMMISSHKDVPRLPPNSSAPTVAAALDPHKSPSPASNWHDCILAFLPNTASESAKWEVHTRVVPMYSRFAGVVRPDHPAPSSGFHERRDLRLVV